MMLSFMVRSYFCTMFCNQSEGPRNSYLGNHPQAEEANEVIAALKVEHANQVQELASKQHVSEEEISLLRKEVSRWNS